jgi:CBS domain containing-hemolysin-like protein
MSEYLIPILIIFFLILINGLFVAAEFAIVGVPNTRIAQRAEEGSSVAKRVLTILRDPDRQNQYIATAQVGITIASLGLGMYGEHTIANWLVPPLEHLGVFTTSVAHSFAVILSIGTLTYLHVVIGEMVPKTIALQSAETSVLRLATPMTIAERLFLPIVWVLNGIGNQILRLIGIEPAEGSARLMSPEELEFVVEESFEGGLIEANEQLFIENIFDLSERTVGQVMTPRNHVIGIPTTMDEQSALLRTCQARFSRLPVYKEDLDHITGILHLKDLARQQVDPEQEFILTELIRPAKYVPESLSLEDMLVQFRRERFQIAVVIDEYGGTAGIVSIEDLVEEVVGEILDEFDQEILPIQELENNVLRVRGDLLIDELNQHFDLKISHPDADSVGGLIMAQLGRIVNPGDKIIINDVRMEVETVKGLVIQTVFVTIPKYKDIC